MSVAQTSSQLINQNKRGLEESEKISNSHCKCLRSFSGESDADDETNDGENWTEVDPSKIPTFTFAGNNNGKLNIDLSPDEITPISIYHKFIDKEVIDLIVHETNKKAQQFLQGKHLTKFSRLQAWKPTDPIEMRKFLAIILYMELVRYPIVADYWSKSPLYQNEMISQVMSRDRFQIILRFIHFSNDDLAQDNESIFKVKDLVELMQQKYQFLRQPGSNVTIDETTIPWLDSQRHKLYLKLYKLCDTLGYTYRVLTCTGKNVEIPPGESLHDYAVRNLMHSFVGEGRIAITNNAFTSVKLANKLLDQNTHLLGLLQPFQDRIPKIVDRANLRRGELFIRQNNRGIAVGKWRDKEDVYFLSTKHGSEMITLLKRDRMGRVLRKPKALIDYEERKSKNENLVQSGSHFSPLWKSLRWFHKVAFELLLRISVINAMIIYNELVHGKTMGIVQFMENIVLTLLVNINSPTSVLSTLNPKKHVLLEFSERVKHGLKRKQCHVCYKSMSKLKGFAYARVHCIKVHTYCAGCEGQKGLCAECFKKYHQ